MEIRKFFWEILPEQTYSITEAAHYLGVNRCTLYQYIAHPIRPLAFIKVPDTVKKLFKGSDLIAYKAAGLPKKGRKKKDKGT